LSAAADDTYQAAVTRIGGGCGAQRQDLVAAPTQGTQVSGQAGYPPAQVERLVHLLGDFRHSFGKLVTKKLPEC
ncbi:MAG: hypothetical protein ACK56I_32860, partial [bacterium]